MVQRVGSRYVSRVMAALVLGASLIFCPARASDVPPILAGNPVSTPLKWAGFWITHSQSEGFLSCTAQFITKRIILLAAHCVRDQDTGKYYDPDNAKTLFLLQYQNDSYSKAYKPLCKYVFDDWVVPLEPGEDVNTPKTMSAERQEAYVAAKHKAWQYDFALVYLDADSITGHYRVHPNERWNGATSTGYPHDMMGGAVIQRVDGDVFNAAAVAFSRGEIPNEQVLWHGNRDYTQGASGGAWVANFSSEEGPDKNIIVGLNSFVADDKPGAMFGPLFRDDFSELLKFTQTHCKPADAATPAAVPPAVSDE